MANKVTLKQIAQEVGLSPSSVSLVLNNRPCRISEENRKLIKEVAARNHYVPNQIARSLVMRESRTLGLIVPNIESRFFASLAGSLEKRCREDGYALFITSSGGSADDDLELLRQLRSKGMTAQIGEIRFEESGIVLRYQDRLDVCLDREDDFAYRLRYLAAVLEKLEENETGTIRWDAEGSARFIPG